MRFVLAIICFVLAALAMGAGIAERTFLEGPNHVTATTVSTTAAPVLVIEGSALNAYKDTQTVKLGGSSETFAAYGRTSDVLAWIGNTNYTKVTFNSQTGKLQSQLHAGKADQVPNPSGSDLWLQQFKGSQANDFDIKVPASMSVIAVSNGTSPAPSRVSLTWPLDNSTPWSAPLILGGAVMLLIGLILILLAFTQLRRARGPRRSQSRMPKLPRQPRYKPKRKAITAAKGRRSVRRSVAVTSTLGLVALALAACSAVPAPTMSTPALGLAPKAVVATKAQEPAVTVSQMREIMQHVAKTVGTADASSDAKLLATRMAGPALEERVANYTIRKRDTQVAPSVAIPATTVALMLPEANDKWPRSVFTVLENKEDPSVAPIAIMLVQDTPRSNYKVNYAIALEPKIVLPKVAPAVVGAVRLNPNLKVLQLAPSAMALAYGDILDNDVASPFYSMFQADGDTFRTQVGMAAKQAAQKKLPTTAKLTYSNADGDGQVIALATNNAGAIVAVDLNEISTVRPVKDGAAVSGDAAIFALSGIANSTKGIVATYGDQLLFYVPSESSHGKIVLLGYSQGLIAAQGYVK